MTNTYRVPNAASAIAHFTRDAYSFRYFGARNWLRCCEMLLGRGYNAIETECIMRSKLTRLASDGRIPMSARYASPRDLAKMLESMGSELRVYVDETALAIMQPEAEKMDSRDALRLVWSR